MSDGLTADPDAGFFPSQTDGSATDLAGNDNEWRAVPSPRLLHDLIDLLSFMDQTDPLTELRDLLRDAIGQYVPDLDSDSSGMARTDLAGALVEVLRSDPDLLDLALGVGRSQLDGRLQVVLDYPDFLDIQLAPGASAAAGADAVRAVLGIVNDAHELSLVLDDWLRTPGREFKVEIEGVTQAAWSWVGAPLVHPRMFDEADALFGKRTELRGPDLADRIEQILVRLDDRDASSGTLDAVAGRLRIAIDHVGAGVRSDDPVLAAADDADRLDVTLAPDEERSTTATDPARTTTTDPTRTTEPTRTTTTVAERTTTTVPDRTTTTTEPDRTTSTTEPDRTTTTQPDRTTTTTPSR